MGLRLVVVSVAAVATAPSVSGARVIVAGTTVRVGVGISVGVRRTRHSLEGEPINRLCCAHAMAVIDQAEQSEDTCLEHKLDEKGKKSNSPSLQCRKTKQHKPGGKIMNGEE